MLAHVLRERRRKLGISQVKLSYLSGVSLPTIQNIELSKANPCFNVLESICRALMLEIQFAQEPPDFALLTNAGLPLSESFLAVRKSCSAKEFQEEMIKLSLFLNEKRNQDPRLMEATQSLLFAIQSHFPNWFKQNLGNIPVIQQLTPDKLDGRMIKLARQARSSISKIL